MATYIVSVLEIQGIGKKVHKGGSRVTDKDFPDGHAKLLESQGKLKAIGLKSDNINQVKKSEDKSEVKKSEDKSDIKKSKSKAD